MSDTVTRGARRRPRGAGIAVTAAAAGIAAALAFGVGQAGAAQPEFPTNIPAGVNGGFIVAPDPVGGIGPAGCNASDKVLICWGDSMHRPSSRAQRRCAAKGVDPALLWRLTRTGRPVLGYTCNGAALGSGVRNPRNLVRPGSRAMIGKFICTVTKGARGARWRKITCVSEAGRTVTFQTRLVASAVL